jgi:hypothetical protein
MEHDKLIQLIAAMNPEMAPLLSLLVSEEKEAPAKRKPSTYNRRYAAAYRRIKRKHTLKNGKMAKGWTGKRGHARIVKMAHAEAKKGGKKR